jgi:glycosidase
MWVSDKKIDGFRFDVAHNVPNDFWEDAKTKILEADSNQFLLAEAEIAEQMNNELFHMAYGWELHHITNDIAKGEKDATDIDAWLSKDSAEYKKGIKMHFTSNHDENSWAGTVFERMKDSHKAFSVLVSTFDGMPLIYGGQEEPLDRRLEFFEKDDIGFKDYEYADFYTKLNMLKHNNEALWNGSHGGELVKLADHKKIYAFSREKNGNEVIVMINLSKDNQTFDLTRDIDQMSELFTGIKSTIKQGTTVNMKPWEYKVYSK